MNNEDELQGWEAEYRTWLARRRPLLDAAQWKDAFADYPFVEFTQTPFTAWTKNLETARLGILTTAGYYVKDQQPRFTAKNIEGDASFRVLPDDVKASDLEIAHDHFPHAAALADWNTVLPLDHLREMAQQGRIKSVGPIFSISGYCTDARELYLKSAKKIAEAAHEAACDAVLLVPV
ncbi:MAG: glycine/sarcosine/betaine reductase selenoprotein B family protein [Pyrinomonadaceae bacterium]